MIFAKFSLYRKHLEKDISFRSFVRVRARCVIDTILTRSRVKALRTVSGGARTDLGIRGRRLRIQSAAARRVPKKIGRL